MTTENEMPEEIWALDDQVEYPRLWEKEADRLNEGTKYIRADLAIDKRDVNVPEGLKDAVKRGCFEAKEIGLFLEAARELLRIMEGEQ